MDQTARFEALQQTIDHVNGGLDQLRAGLERLEKRLRLISDGQEAFELQLALLSKEAEQYDSRFSLLDGDDSPNAEAIRVLRGQVAKLSVQVERLLAGQTGQAAPHPRPGEGAVLGTTPTAAGRGMQPDQERADLIERAVSAGDLPDRRHPAEDTAATVDAAQIATRLQALVDEVRALKTAGGYAYDRLVRLGNRHRKLNRSLRTLSLEQARKNSETQASDRRQKRGSLISLAALLLAITSLAIVWFKMAVPTQADEPAPPVQATVTDSGHTEVSIVARELEQLREDMRLFDQSLARISRTVDDLRSAPAPASAREFGHLAKTVGILVETGGLQTKAIERLQRGLQQQAGANADTPAAPSIDEIDPALPRPSGTAALTPPPEPDPPPRPAESPRSAAPAGSDLQGSTTNPQDAVQPYERWTRAGDRGLYTLQLIGARERRSIDGFLRRHRLQGDHAIHVGERLGEPWFAVLHGLYESRSAAMAAVAELPGKLPEQAPWVRRVPSSGHLETE
jgi:septal ring-binding cell division protein DamX